MENEPTVHFMKTGFFQTQKAKFSLAVGSCLLIFVILISLLQYFNIIKLPWLFKATPGVTIDTTLQITLDPKTYGFKAGDENFSCPVQSDSCKSQKLIKTASGDAVIYRAATSSAVAPPAKIPSILNVAIMFNEKDNKKYFYESYTSKDGLSCYTISYTLPGDASIADILKPEVINQTGKIASLGNGTFKIENSEANIMIQVRATPLEKSKNPCSLNQKPAEFFKP